MDEEKAIQLCLKDRDPSGFEFLVQKYRREAFGHAFALMGNQEDALDACQDAFAKAFAAIPALRQLPQFYPWFYCILRNRCLNLIDRRRTSDRYRQEQHSQPERHIDPITPRTVLNQREDQERVQAALARLAPEHREILLMKYAQEHSYDQIANLLALPRGTVMSRLYHARLALRDEYSRMDDSKSLVQEVK